MINNIKDLEKRIENHSIFFDMLIDLIPTTHYLPKEEIQNENEKYYHNKKKPAMSKQEIKETAKKSKKARFDPNNVKSVQSIQNEKEINENINENDSVTNENSIENETENNKEINLNDIKPMSKVSNITELQEKLKSRINDLRAQRKAQNTNSIHSRDELLKKRLKRKQDRKEQIKQRKEKRRKTNDMVGMDVSGTTESKEEQQKESKQLEENVSFGKIVFNENEDQKKKKGPTDTLGKLKKVEAKKSKIEKLKTIDNEKANELEEKLEWNKVMKMAEGEKIKDDPKLLKKTLKREQKLKERSAKKWNDRKRTVNKQMMEKQKRRQENLQERINSKGKGKGKKNNKKRHGFEGAGLKRKK